jgi:hypothetical protein
MKLLVLVMLIAIATPTWADAPTSAPEAPLLSAEPSDSRIHADAMLGYSSQNLNLGLGLRGGKAWENHFYLGGLLVYALGTSSSASTDGITASGSMHGLYIGPEAGYELRFNALPVVFRPYVGLGISSAFGSATAAGMSVSGSSTEVGFWPGIAARYRLSSVDIGGDFRIVTGPWGTAVGLFVTGGMFLGS